MLVGALGHDEIAHEAKAPTCTEIGWDEYVTCSRCDYSTYVEKEALNHTEETIPAVDADCVNTGLTAGKKCSVCGAILVAQQVVPSTGHSYEETVTEPTCENDGYTTYTCACGDTYTETIPATGHSYNAVVTEPTCGNGGYTTYTCSCGDSYVGDETEALGHDWSEKIFVSGDCKTGVTYKYECKRCSESYEEVVTTAKDHTIPKGADGELLWTVSEATCEQGRYYTYGCAVCNMEVKVFDGPALGHNWELQPNSRPATCGMAGFNEYHCDRCDGTKREDLPKLGHNMVAGADKAPTCSEDGYTNYRHCLNCGFELYDVVEKTGHADKNGDGLCDGCKNEFSSGNCGCFCHSNNWFIRIIYAIIRFIWKVFNIHRDCLCGAVHF